MGTKVYSIRIRVWDDYVIDVEAESEKEALDYIYRNIDEVDSMGWSCDGGRDVDESSIYVRDITEDDWDDTLHKATKDEWDDLLHRAMMRELDRQDEHDKLINEGLDNRPEEND